MGFDVYETGDGKSDWESDTYPDQGRHIENERAYLSRRTVIFEDRDEAFDALDKIREERRDECKFVDETSAARHYGWKAAKDMDACNQRKIEETYYVIKVKRAYYYKYA